VVVVTILIGLHVCEAFLSPRVVLLPSLQHYHRPKRFVVIYEQQQQEQQLRSPKPPSIPPPASDDFLEQTLKEQEDLATTVQVLKQKVVDLATELAEKQNALENLLQSGISIVEQEEEAAERERLEREVEILQGQLPVIQNLYKTERVRAAELEEKIQDLDYMLEYQQMEFEKIQTGLKKELEEERGKLRKLQVAMKELQDNYNALEQKSQQQLTEKAKQTEEVQKLLSEKQEEFEAQRKQFEEQLEVHAEKVKAMEAELKEQYKLQSEGTVSLQAEIVREREISKVVKKSLKDAEQQHAIVESTLKAQLKSETSRADELAKRLEQEQERFESTQTTLLRKLLEESFRITALEDQLKKERLEAQTREKLLQDRYDHEIRVRRLKKEQMANRYDQIRKEMTALWQNARREGRQQAEMLTKKYEGAIGDLQSTILRLEQDVIAAVEENASLKKKLEHAMKGRKAARERRLQSESDVSQLITRQNAEIESLQADLKQVLDIVDEKEQEMTAFRSSWSALLKAGVKLTVQRVLLKPVKSVRQRVVGRVRHKEASSSSQ
jgi:DNA repair exonuclease SbcCD ATPase subunit